MAYITLIILLYASTAYGAVYSWVDASGVRHYVNKAHEIPPRYKSKAKALYPEPGDTGTLQQSVEQTQQTSPAVTAPVPQPPAATGKELPVAEPPRHKPPQPVPAKRVRRPRTGGEEE